MVCIAGGARVRGRPQSLLLLQSEDVVGRVSASVTKVTTKEWRIGKQGNGALIRMVEEEGGKGVRMGIKKEGERGERGKTVCSGVARRKGFAGRKKKEREKERGEGYGDGAGRRGVLSMNEKRGRERVEGDDGERLG
ncbi:hypothetical protein ES288_A01G157700v1 [Gossypium darwinii]|uniref:Uncharacterized protein n=1 Tax=Gossypium darwinii TaxID=34276 RepID=A0A5D2HLQ6_GOSDA|nr:hypothetical protein ES288_A01G157700v1 [Gossypium darwinii]